MFNVLVRVTLPHSLNVLYVFRHTPLSQEPEPNTNASETTPSNPTTRTFSCTSLYQLTGDIMKMQAFLQTAHDQGHIRLKLDNLK
jgi:hypothetical protein